MTQIAWNTANQFQSDGFDSFCRKRRFTYSNQKSHGEIKIIPGSIMFVPVTLNANLAMQQMSHGVVGHVDGTVRPESNSGLLEGKWG